MPAKSARLRGRVPGAGRARSDRQICRGHQRRGQGSLRSFPGRGLDHHAHGRRADFANPPPVQGAGYDWRLRNLPAGFRRCAISRTFPISSRRCTRSPEYISTLSTSTAIADHVPVDFELRGCPINKHQLLEVIGAFINGRRPATPAHSVCIACKRRGTVCVMVAKKIPCLGPITHDGCGAICPAYGRGCYGCYGPAETINAPSLASAWHGGGRVQGRAASRTARL